MLAAGSFVHKINHLTLPLLITASFVVVVHSGCNGDAGDSGQTDAEVEQLSGELKPFRLTINFGEQRESVTGTIQYTENLTSLDLLLAVAAQNRVKVDYDGQGETAFVKAIGGLVGGKDGNPWWIYSVNSELAGEGCGTLMLVEGDEVIWRMGKYPE